MEPSPNRLRGLSRSAVRLLAAACLAAVPCGRPDASAAESPADRLSYNKDIRPLLVENCFACHGADSAGRKADLRLDRRDDAVEHGAIVPGDPDSTAILDRVFSMDPDVVMPPPETKKTLSAEQKDLLVRWVREGAEYEPHWSFIPPARPAPPAVSRDDWVRNPIDRFVLARLESAGLTPAVEADRRTLARRVALDLTGLPPEPALVEAFVVDPHPDAYERLVDALLASLEWGEHRGRHWLDYARYADTHGIHFDNEREMWTYRQWVINAFNRNMPFDEFTILQLAGDLVSDHGAAATPEQVLDNRIASGFNRCNMTTNEGGIIDEEYIVIYARDRTETTATVWMGLTAGCAVCHDHKFDPISMRDFYELSAFFNNTTQAAKDGNIKDTPPVLPVPLAADQPRFLEVERELPAVRAAVAARRQAARAEFDAWMTRATPDVVRQALPQDTPLVRLSFAEGSGPATKAVLMGKETDLPLTATTTWQAGPSGEAAILLDGKAGELAASGDLEHDRPFSVSFWIRVPANDSSYAVVSRMDVSESYRGWDVWVQGRRVGMHLIHTWPEDALKVVSADQLKADTWTLVSMTYDGSGKAEGVGIFFDGKPQKPKVETNKFKKHTIRTDVPLVIGGRSQGATAHAVGLADLTVWGRRLSVAEVEGLSRAELLADIVRLPADQRLAAAGGLYDWWLGSFDETFKQVSGQEAKLVAEDAAIRRRGTVAHVMAEKPEPPMAYILDRGEYDKRLEQVGADTPGALPAFPPALPRNRLGLARWLLLDEHPLTTRVTVNRFWQEVFGTGLVRTAGDFGITGELPSHPDLLDWLAVEFRESGWDVKRLFRLIVTSATYRQAAVVTPEKIHQDRDNRLLSRGPRFRMDGEMVRDQALAASGLLVRRIGGPSVKPYQPPGVWEAVSMGGNTSRYEQGTGADLYRRSMYWFWKRSAPPASMDILNAPSREICTVRRERTNTPLQALVTLNDPQFVEAARALADRALLVGGPSDEERLDFMALRLLARPLAAAERAVLRGSLTDLEEWYRSHPEDARSLITVGASKPQHEDDVRLASWTLIANELLNLDEAVCK